MNVTPAHIVERIACYIIEQWKDKDGKMINVTIPINCLLRAADDLDNWLHANKIEFWIDDDQVGP